jgi:hypothetical protein
MSYNKQHSQPLVAPFDSKEESNGTPIIIKYLLDASGSMQGITEELADSFNHSCLAAILGAHKSTKPMIRVGAAAFGDELVHIIPGYRALHELGEAPVSVKQLTGPGLGNCTALFKSVIQGYGQLVQASDLVHTDVNKYVDAELVVLTDGRNNLEPSNTEEVRKVITWRQEYVRVKKILVYFKTHQGLVKREFADMARACGFDHAFFIDEHNTDRASLLKALRHTMNILSNPTNAAQNFKSQGIEDLVGTLDWNG